MEFTPAHAKAKFSMIEQSCIRLVGAPGMEIGNGGVEAQYLVLGIDMLPYCKHPRKAAQKSLLTKVLPVARVGNFACSSCPFDQFNGDWRI